MACAVSVAVCVVLALILLAHDVKTIFAPDLPRFLLCMSAGLALGGLGLV